ncbi:MAG: MotA/TolQ/ExbB proton channel family protein [Myxococcota bacterium]
MKELMHLLVDALAWPVHFALLLGVAASVVEVGLTAGERLVGIERLRSAAPQRVDALARARIERVDLLARLGPMIGLMGTLIPLGPGLSALGRGDVQRLAEAVIVAFDTTVLGLLIGALAFVIGRLRRRWYDTLLTSLEQSDD